VATVQQERLVNKNLSKSLFTISLKVGEQVAMIDVGGGSRRKSLKFNRRWAFRCFIFCCAAVCAVIVSGNNSKPIFTFSTTFSAQFFW
jgi:hypothetical protein